MGWSATVCVCCKQWPSFLFRFDSAAASLVCLLGLSLFLSGSSFFFWRVSEHGAMEKKKRCVNSERGSQTATHKKDPVRGMMLTKRGQGVERGLRD